MAFFNFLASLFINSAPRPRSDAIVLRHTPFFFSSPSPNLPLSPAYSRIKAAQQHFTMDSVFEWQPNRFLQDDRSQSFALLVLNQPLKNGSNLRKLWRNCMPAK